MLLRLALASLALTACGVGHSTTGDAGGDAPTADADTAVPLPDLPLHASSRWIVDPHGKRFKLASVSWYGAESPDHVVAGLELADLHAIARFIHAQGFNSVRLPWSNELVEQNPLVDASKVAANPSLAGLHALDVLDQVIAALAHEGLLVILDNHVSRADWCCSDSDGNGLWYTPDYPETSWIADWQTLAARYVNQPAVAAVDLRNEPRSVIQPASCTACTSCPCAASTGCTCMTAAWGGSDPTVDWRAAATRAAQAVLGSNPNVLVIVEGVHYAGDLTGVYGNPVDLGALQDHLVYEAHEYSFFHTSLVNSSNPTYDQLKTLLGDNWGYILTQNQTFTAPIWVGEFGTCHGSTSCLAGINGIGWWFQAFSQYLTTADIDWSYWAINGTESTGYHRTYGSEESYGVLDTTWTQPALPALVSDLQALQPATQGP